MNEKIKPLQLIFIVFITAAAGAVLKFFELDTYLIFLGFRFHLGSILPFLIIIKRISFSSIKIYFTSPEYKKQTAQVLWIFVPLLAVAALYITGLIELTDPEYFYEFGVSSIVDYPIYLVWNFLQFSALFVFLTAVRHSFKNQFVVISVVIIFLFSYEAVPSELKRFDYYSLFTLITAAVSGALIIKYFSNIYWFTISMFTLLWASLLLFGTGSEAAVNILFAARYDSWEGFLTAGKAYDEYLVPAYAAVFFLLVVISSLVKRKVN